MLNALTIDVEEYFQAHAYEHAIDRAAWDRLPARVVENSRRILRILAEHGTRATFFVLGWVADRHPALIAEIAAAGHELASHGYAHQLLYRQTPAEFAADLERSLAAIRRAAGAAGAVVGYRAPGFSLTDESLWALDVLSAHGIRYDSSLQPVANGSGARLRGGKRTGIAGAGRFATRLAATGSSRPSNDPPGRAHTLFLYAPFEAPFPPFQPPASRGGSPCDQDPLSTRTGMSRS